MLRNGFGLEIITVTGRGNLFQAPKKLWLGPEKVRPVFKLLQQIPDAFGF